MAKSLNLTASQRQDLQSILEKRHVLLQKQENLDFGKLVNTAKEGLDSEREEFSASASTASAEQELSERHTHEMHGIEHAFLRLHSGTYGVCVDCQSPIDFPRLLAYPTALRCMKCQEALELLEKRAHK